jgi:hypothetical protein
MKRTIWMMLNVLFAVLFLFAAVVQYNDPDPLPWMLIYGAAIVACLLVLRRSRAWIVPAAIALCALVWAGLLAPAAQGVRFRDMFAEFEMRDAGIEVAREVFGLLIIGAWMILVTIGSMRAKAQTHRRL